MGERISVGGQRAGPATGRSLVIPPPLPAHDRLHARRHERIQAPDRNGESAGQREPGVTPERYRSGLTPTRNTQSRVVSLAAAC